MFDLIKWEIKKNLRPGVIVAWVIGLMLGFNMVFTNFGIEETLSQKTCKSIWDRCNEIINSEVRTKLLNDDYEISNDLDKYIGRGS